MDVKDLNRVLRFGEPRPGFSLILLDYSKIKSKIDLHISNVDNYQ